MSKYLTLQNLGWLLTAFVTIMLGMGGVSKNRWNRRDGR